MHSSLLPANKARSKNGALLCEQCASAAIGFHTRGRMQPRPTPLCTSVESQTVTAGPTGTLLQTRNDRYSALRSAHPC